MSIVDVIVGGGIAIVANVALFAAGEGVRRRQDRQAAVVALGGAAVHSVNMGRTVRAGGIDAAKRAQLEQRSVC